MSRSRRRSSVARAVVLVVFAACVGDSTSVGPVAPGRPLSAVAADPVVLVGAGDIATAGIGDQATALLLDGIAGTVFAAGDNAYPDGTTLNYNDYYEPTWGRHKARTRPSPGNHDYHVPGGADYFAYFGPAAGEPGKGYYGYDLGEWHVIALNSNIAMNAGSAQEQWLRADLAATTKQCVAAYWHHPRWTSTEGRSTRDDVKPLWDALYNAGAELIINGHDHLYERFAPMKPDGTVDQQYGLRQITVGTGGAGLYPFGIIHPNSEARNNTAHGVLRLTLGDVEYAWEFVPVAGQTYHDAETAECHGPPGSPPLNKRPAAAFTQSCTALTCTFTDQSTDDGGVVARSWSFGDGQSSTLQNPPHTYGAGGTYTVALTVTDGAGATNATSRSMTLYPGIAGALAVRVAASADDAEEAASGAVALGSSDLELVFDGSNQTVGLRFTGVTIPRGATITSASLQFQVDQASSEATSLTIQGQATDQATAFTTATGNISSRSRTASAVAWAPAAWTTVGQAGAAQQTPNIAAIIQAIVNRPGWASGNALVILITGTGRRVGESYNGLPGAAPLLRVEYLGGS